MLDAGVGLIGAIAHELALFAAVGFLLWGVDDLLVDAIWLARGAWRRVAVYSRHRRADAAALPAAAVPGGLAVLIPAWDESRVIRQMLSHALNAWGNADVTLFVGCYRNDLVTRAVVTSFSDPRVVAAPVPRGIM